MPPLQSLLFVLSAGAYVWWFGSLRSFLLRAEGQTGRLASVAFGAGVIWAGLQLVLQCFWSQMFWRLGCAGRQQSEGRIR